MRDKLNSIIPCMGIYEFLDKLENYTVLESEEENSEIDKEHEYN